jgi:hypothetical protein
MSRAARALCCTWWVFALGASCVPDANLREANEVAGGAGGSGGQPAETGSAGAENGPSGASPELLHGFASGTEGFALNNYTLADPAYRNVSVLSTLCWVSYVGVGGTPGALSLAVPFDGYDQIVSVEVQLANAADFRDKVLRASVMANAGFSPDPSAPGGAFLSVKTGNQWVWGRGDWFNLERRTFGTWQTIEFKLNTPSQWHDGYDPSQVIAIDIDFHTGSGVNAEGTPAATVFFVDEITLSST